MPKNARRGNERLAPQPGRQPAGHPCRRSLRPVTRDGRSALRSKVNDHVIEHHAAGDQLEAGAAHESQESADRRLERRPGALPFDEEFGDERAQQAAQNHPHRGNEHPGEESDDGAHARGLMPARDAGEHPRYDEIHDCHDDCDSQPDQQEGQAHGLSGAVQAFGEKGEQQPHPADGRSRDAGYDAADDADEGEKYGENLQNNHFTLVLSKADSMLIN